MNVSKNVIIYFALTLLLKKLHNIKILNVVTTQYMSKTEVVIIVGFIKIPSKMRK